MKEIIPVTVIIPVKNEEKNLAACLKCLDGFQKIYIVDSGSTDATRTIAEEFGIEVVDFRWNGEFPKKRNWALRNLSFETDWVLCLDADEFMDEKFKDELRCALPETPHSGFILSYTIFFMGKMLHRAESRKLALFRRSAGEYERIDEDHWSALDMEVHEHPVLLGSIGSLKTPIRHEDFKGLKAYISRHNEYSSWEAERYRKLHAEQSLTPGKLRLRQRIKYRLLNSYSLGILYFLYAYIVRLGFLDGIPGLVFCTLKMHYFQTIKFKLEELKRTAK